MSDALPEKTTRYYDLCAKHIWLVVSTPQKNISQLG